jgi:putative phage-type endonuclease
VSSIKILNDQHWHELRQKYIGASESAALFGLLPWKTPWQLFMEKSGKLPAPDIDDVKHIKEGKHFEPAIASWAQEHFGITLQKARRYLVDDAVSGMGASLDYEQVGTGERIPTELKWVVRSDDRWEYEGDLIIEAPDYYLVQVQHQIACADASCGQLIAFINGGVRRAIYKRRDGMIAAIRQNISKFWHDVAAGNEPPIDFQADADAVMRYATALPSKRVDWTPEIARLAKRAHWMQGFKARAEKACDAAKAELAHMMIATSGTNDPEAKIVTEGDGFRISNTFVPDFAGKEITEDMVGTRIFNRSAYRLVTVSRPKPKPERKPRRSKAETDKTAEDRADYVDNSAFGRGEGAKSADAPIQIISREDDE